MPSILSARQERLLACLIEQLTAVAGATVTYETEWLGYLPFGQYHSLNVTGGDVLRDLPDDWERDDLLALEREGLLVRVDEWHDPNAPDDLRLIFRLDDGRVAAWLQPDPDVSHGPPASAGESSGLIVGPLHVCLPDEWRLRCRERSQQSMHGPPGSTASEEKCIWETGDGREFWLFHWIPMAPRPGGPMQAAREWNATVAGLPTTIIETRVFMGQTRRAMVAHLRLASPASQVLIIGEGMEHPEFAKLLDCIRRVS